MKAEQHPDEGKINYVNESTPQYLSGEALEEARLKQAMERTDSEKFYFLMNLMKMNSLMKKAIIHHKD